jgi:ABC-type dipeptide/oligopeptide/nickel transport system permease component
MGRFLVRRVFSLALTMFIVSIVVFGITELAPGDVVRHMLGQFATPEQEDSMREQLGLNRPVWVRYVSWLVGSDLLWAQPTVGMPLRQTIAKATGSAEWWAEEPDGTLIRWRLEGDDLIAVRRQVDGTVVESVDNGRWNVDREAEIRRLQGLREVVIFHPELTLSDRQAILTQVDALIALLDQDDLTSEELVAAIEIREQGLDALRDPVAEEQRQVFLLVARGLRNNELVDVLTAAQELSETTDEEFLQTLPSRLGKAATALAAASPELSEQIRAASKNISSRDIGQARALLAEAAGPISELTVPITDLAQAIEEDAYSQVAAVLEAMVDPATVRDVAATAVLIDALGDVAKTLEDPIPELSEYLNQASESLEAGDMDEARAALVSAGALVREREPAIARTEAAKKARIGRYFWGVDNANHVVKWQTGGEEKFWRKAVGAGWWIEQEGGASEYIPLQKGFLRGDPGESIKSRQPVGPEIVRRLRNSLVLAGLAFIVVMPLALFMGVIAGLNEGKPSDRVLSIFGLVTTASPNFATGVFLILIFVVWLNVLPGATVFTSSTAIFENPKMLVLPVLTLTLIELGYVLRITRASMVEVMKAPYIRTAYLKGLPHRRIVTKHAIRNAMLAPITVIMLHVNWLIGGIVVVEAIFGFPGLGTYLLSAALYKDLFAIEAGAMVLVIVAVGTQLVADVIYTFLNPRIRYA